MPITNKKPNTNKKLKKCKAGKRRSKTTGKCVTIKEKSASKKSAPAKKLVKEVQIVPPPPKPKPVVVDLTGPRKDKKLEKEPKKNPKPAVTPPLPIKNELNKVLKEMDDLPNRFDDDGMLIIEDFYRGDGLDLLTWGDVTAIRDGRKKIWVVEPSFDHSVSLLTYDSFQFAGAREAEEPSGTFFYTGAAEISWEDNKPSDVVGTGSGFNLYPKANEKMLKKLRQDIENLKRSMEEPATPQQALNEYAMNTARLFMAKNAAKKTPKKAPKKTPKNAPKKTPKAPKKSRGCVEQTTKKYTSRPSPPYPANECPSGMKMNGNDGNLYVATPDSNGINRWTRANSR